MKKKCPTILVAGFMLLSAFTSPVSLDKSSVNAALNIGCDLFCDVLTQPDGSLSNTLTVTSDPGICGAQIMLPAPVVLGCAPPGSQTNLLTEGFDAGSLPGGWNLTFDGTGGSTSPGSCGNALFSFLGL